jgi:hypothetical protein
MCDGLARVSDEKEHAMNVSSCAPTGEDRAAIE